MTNIGAQMRDNPLPLLLISAGVGLMMSRSFRNDGYSGGLGMYRDDASGDLMRRTADPTAGFGNDRDDYRSRPSSSSPGVLSSIGDAMSSMTEAVSSQAASLADNVRDTYSSSVDRMADMTDRAEDYTGRARIGLATLANEQPLVLGGLGLLAGAALAAMLPRTQMEADYVGAAAQQVRDQASSMASETMERAKSAASKAVEVVSEEFSGEAAPSGSHASGGASQTAVASTGGASTSGAAALGVSPSGSGGARPFETIAAGASAGQGYKTKT